MTAGAINLFNMGWIIRDLWWDYKQNTPFFQNYIIYGVKTTPSLGAGRHFEEMTKTRRAESVIANLGQSIILGNDRLVS